MPQWYRVDTSKLSWDECKRQAPNFLTYLVLAVMKLLGKGLSVPGAVPRLDDPAVVPGEAVPGTISRELAHRAQALARLPESFRTLCYQAPPHRGGTVMYAVALLSEDGRTVARIMHATSGSTRKIVTALHSWRPDGMSIATGDKAQEFDHAPKTSSRSLPGAEPAALSEAHRRHVTEVGGKQGVRVLTDADVPAMLLAYDQQGVDYLARRGVLVRLSAEELARM